MASSPQFSANGVAELSLKGACLPGESILLLSDGAVVVLGGGLRVAGRKQIDEAEGLLVVATAAGHVKKTQLPAHPVRYELISNSVRRYFPRKEDPVVGIITKVTTSTYFVHINGAFPAVLDVLAFDGASKANRPRLAVSDVVYCHVVRAERDIEVELSCMAVSGNVARDWTTGEGTFGPLSGGTLVYTGIQYASDLMKGTAPVLPLLGERIPYETCVGLNGITWVSAIEAPREAGSNQQNTENEDTLPATLAIAECIRELEGETDYDKCLEKFMKVAGDDNSLSTGYKPSSLAETQDIIRCAIQRRVAEHFFPSCVPPSDNGACFLLMGKAQSGKTHLVDELFKEIQDTFSKDSEVLDKHDSNSFWRQIISADTGIKSFSVVSREVDAARAMRVVFSNNTTMLHHELFGESSVTAKSFFAPGNINNDGAANSRETLTNFVINLVKWEHFDLFFARQSAATGEESGLQPSPYSSGDSQQTKPFIKNLFQGFSAGQGNESNAATFGEDCSVVNCYASSNELLTHLFVLSQQINGYLTSPISELCLETSSGGAQFSERQIVLTFLVCLCSTSNVATLDPFLLDDSVFPYRLCIPTPTELERSNIFTDANVHAPLARHLAARTGGYGCGYLHQLARYVAAVQCSSLPEGYQDRGRISNNISDSSPLVDDMVERFTEAFEAERNRAIADAAEIMNGACEGDAVDDVRSGVGYVDVQRTLWTDIAGLDEVKKQLNALIAAPLRVKDEYQRLGLISGVGAVLYGPPGTGKTLLAKAVATEVAASFVYIDLPQLINSAIGDSEAILDDFFSVAKQRAPSIIFVDELQAAFGRRYDSERGGDNSAHDARLVSALAWHLDDISRNFYSTRVMFIGATNHIDLLDPSLLRPGRLDIHIYVGPPDSAARLQIIRMYTEAKWCAWVPQTRDEITQKQLETLVQLLLQATAGMTGAEIKNALNQFVLSLIFETQSELSSDGKMFKTLFVDESSQLKNNIYSLCLKSCSRTTEFE